MPAGVVAGSAKLGLGIGLPVVWSFIARKPVSVNGPSLPSRQEMPVAGSGSETVNIQSWFERIGISFGMKREGSSTSPIAARRWRECSSQSASSVVVDEIFEQAAILLIGLELVERRRLGALVGKRLDAQPVLREFLRQQVVGRRRNPDWPL